MKILKIVLVSLVIMVVCAVVGLFIFIKTVDLDRHLPPITEQVAKSTGRELKVKKAKLNLSLQGLGLELSDIAMSDDARFSDKPFLTVGKVVLGVDLGAILGGKIVVTEILLASPRINIIRDKDGLINAATIGAAPAKPATTSQQAKPAAAIALPAFLVKSFRIDGASVQYADQMLSPAVAVTVDQIAVVVKDFSVTAPFDLSLKAAVFSSEQNITMTSRVGLDLVSLGVKAENVRADLDLGKVALDKLMASLPQLRPAGLKEMGGVVSLGVDSVLAGPAGLKTLRATVKMSGGRVILNAFPVPVENIAMSIDGDENRLTVKDLSGTVSGGVVRMNGVVRDYMTSPQVELSGTATGIEAGGISAAFKTPVKARGKVAVEFNSNFSGRSPEEILGSLNGGIKADITEGALEGINLLATGLGNIPMLPGLLAMVQSSLPPETQADLQKGITLINSCQFEARSTAGTISLNKAEIVTRDLVASASGTAGLTGDVAIAVKLYIQKALSDVLVGKVSSLQGLRMEDGSLYIPLYIQGPLAKPQVQPDTEYLSKRLLNQELQKVLDKNPEVQGVLNAIFGGPSPKTAPAGQATAPDGSAEGQGQPAAQDAQSTQGETTTGQAVDALFNSLFKKK